MFGTFLRSQTLLIGLQGNWGGVTGYSGIMKRQKGVGARMCVCVCVRSRKGLFNESKVATVSFRLGGYVAREMS